MTTIQILGQSAVCEPSTRHCYMHEKQAVRLESRRDVQDRSITIGSLLLLVYILLLVYREVCFLDTKTNTIALYHYGPIPPIIFFLVHWYWCDDLDPVPLPLLVCGP